jgi:List-Bact-rpt repeat protein
MRTYGSFFILSGLACLLAASGPGCDDGDGGDNNVPRLQADWQTVWFDTVRGRPQSEPLIVKVTNDGLGTTRTLETGLVGDVDAFRIADDKCAGRLLSPRASCTIALVLSAGEVGPFDGALRVWSSATLGQPGTQIELPLRGKMANAELRVTADQPSKDAFGSTTAFAITVENAGGLPSGPVALSATGPFELRDDTCTGRRLGGGAICTLTATYTVPADPTSGSVSALINAEAEPGGAASTTVMVNVPAGGALIVPAVDFGAVPTATSSVKTVPVRNPSNRAVTITGASVVNALPDFSDVVITRDGCAGVTLMPQGSCEIDVRLVESYRLEPPIYATLTVQDNGFLLGSGLVRGTRVRAHFNLDVLLDEASTGTGTVSLSDSNVYPLPLYFVGANGTTETLRAVPDAGSVFLGWSGACNGTADCVLTPRDNANVEVKALFGTAL